MPTKKLSQDDFILKCSIKHCYKYEYSKVVYNGTKNTIIVICPLHGEFIQKAAYHLRGNGCSICAQERTARANTRDNAGVILQLRQIKPEYDFSKFIYKGINIPATITCLTHGDFKARPNDVINYKTGCPQCAIDRSRLSYVEFVLQANQVHNNRYNYSKLVYNGNAHNIVITCSVHGDFNQLAGNHLQGHGCQKCSYFERGKNRSILVNEFLLMAKQIHNNKYEYDVTNYINTNSRVGIICPIHGHFTQRATNHIHQKQGCKQCGTIGVYTEHLFKINPALKAIPGRLYIIKFISKDEVFWKVGITKRPVQVRWGNLKTYKIIIEYVLEGQLYDLFRTEQYLLRAVIANRVNPHHKIGGDSECFILQQPLLELVQEICNYHSSLS